MEKNIRIRWARVILTSIGAYLATLLLITLVVTVYAFKLAFAVRGAPDQTRIVQFSQHFVTSWGLVPGLLVTFGAAIWVARKARTSTALHGVLIGSIVAILGLIVAHTFSIRALIDFVATIASGWLGGRVGGWTITNRPKASPSNTSST